MGPHPVSSSAASINSLAAGPLSTFFCFSAPARERFVQGVDMTEVLGDQERVVGSS